ncbi:MAG: alanine--glyoxylate aminotransferase family protein [Erysipelotrichia bacterium]|nr:alanine--glyoxylate aminotransferase family protein [Erysipelotrichia bacterium]
MKIFTVGPVEMFERTLKVRSKPLPYFRTDDFSKVMLEIQTRLQRVLYTKKSSKCAIITGSGSAAMEAVVSNSFNQEDKLLIINGGSFGQRFVKLCEIYHIPFDEVKLAYDEALTQAHLEQFKDGAYTAMLVNIHETSTGQLYDIKMLSTFCKQKQMKLVVDAISSFLSDPFHMDEDGVDCVIISSQKALSLAPGLSMVVMNEDFYDSKVKDKEMINLYLNLNEHIKNMERGQTPNTPAVGICFELLDMLRYVEEKGVDVIVNETHTRAMRFREMIKPLGLHTPAFPLSNKLKNDRFITKCFICYI